MARKSFKSGLGSLIQDSRVNSEKEKANEVVSNENLLSKINELNEELHLWRTGKLTFEIFIKSMKENKIKYNKFNNSFSQI
ncbi:MAG: hypothetical protein ABFS35_11245 [Bacteroidota bacterium]